MQLFIEAKPGLSEISRKCVDDARIYKVENWRMIASIQKSARENVCRCVCVYIFGSEWWVFAVEFNEEEKEEGGIRHLVSNCHTIISHQILYYFSRTRMIYYLFSLFEVFKAFDILFTDRTITELYKAVSTWIYIYIRVASYLQC